MGFDTRLAHGKLGGENHRTLVLLVERAVATPPAEGVGLGVPLTANSKR